MQQIGRPTLYVIDKGARTGTARDFPRSASPSVVIGILVHAEEEDLVGRLVVDEEGEGVVGNELRVEERPRRPEAEQRCGGGRLAPLLVDLDERLVQRAVERHVVPAALRRRIDEPAELAGGRVEERLQPEGLQRLSQLVRLGDLEPGQLHRQVVDRVEAGLDLGHHALQRIRGQPGGGLLWKEPKKIITKMTTSEPLLLFDLSQP